MGDGGSAASSWIAAWRRAAAAAEVAEGRVRGSIPETRPESPMKDKPTARRPPAESGIDVPTPRVGRAAEPRTERSADQVVPHPKPTASLEKLWHRCMALRERWQRVVMHGARGSPVDAAAACSSARGILQHRSCGSTKSCAASVNVGSGAIVMKSAPKKVSVGVGSKREVGSDGVAEGSGPWRAAGGVDHGFLDGRELTRTMCCVSREGF